MSYIKADEVLPQNIIKIIQQYIDRWGKYLHPKEKRLPQQLGSKNGRKNRAVTP